MEELADVLRPELQPSRLLRCLLPGGRMEPLLHHRLHQLGVCLGRGDLERCGGQ